MDQRSARTLPLFERYPLLRESLGYVALGEFPTPVRRLARLGADLEIDSLYLKDDGLSGVVYGGNKIRKLEFLLGRALRQGVKEVLTFGYAGSNHAAATAVSARQVSLRSISMLLPQPNARYVGLNLLMSHHYGAEIHHRESLPALTLATAYQLCRRRLADGVLPAVIPPGGSSPYGTIGYVNAAFELAQQIARGELPAPDRIFVPLGSMGTAVGLMIGLRAAGLDSRVVAVRTVDKRYAGPRRIMRLFEQTVKLLRAHDETFPALSIAPEDVDVRDEHFGPGYGHFTSDGIAAASQMKATEGIQLDGTYTAKTLAALVDDARDHAHRARAVLFWNTCNARDLSEVAISVDYRELPRRLHRYFEEEAQPLDAELCADPR